MREGLNLMLSEPCEPPKRGFRPVAGALLSWTV